MKKKKSFSLTVKILLPIAVLMSITVGTILFYVYDQSFENTVTSSINRAKETISQFKLLRGYYTKHVISVVKRESSIKMHVDHKGDPKAIPLPATLIHDLSTEFAKKKNGVQLKLYSDFPFPNRSNRKLDQFQQEAIKALNKNPEDAFTKVEGIGNNRIVRVAIADKLVAKGCVSCHNNHPQTPKKDWKLGDVRGILEVDLPISSQLVATKNVMTNILYIGLFSMVLVLLIIACLVTKGIKKPFTLLTENLNQDSNDLGDLAKCLNEVSDTLASSSNAQAAATQESVAAMEEMSSMIQQTNEFTKSSQMLAGEVKNKTDEGDRIMKELVNSMELIQQSNSQLQNMSNIIGDISNKTNVINDIVFKTQLLSFNASIEAARAGQHGKGFAVVAEEVGNLAQMSGDAAQEIKELLDDSQKQVSQIIESTQTKVLEGKLVSDKALEIFQQISDRINVINEQIQRIAEATKEQSDGVDQASEAIVQMDEEMKNNNSIAAKTLNYSEELKELSTRINNINTIFKVLVFGNQEISKKKNKSGIEGLIEDYAGSNSECEDAIDSKLIGKLTSKASSVSSDYESIDADHEGFKEADEEDKSS